MSMQGEQAIVNDENKLKKSPAKSPLEEDADENEIEKVYDGNKRPELHSGSVLEYRPGHILWDNDLDDVTSHIKDGCAFTLSYSDEDEVSEDDDYDDSDLTLIPGMVVPPFLMDFTKDMFAKADDKTLVVSFLEREITEDSQLLELFKPYNPRSAKLAIAPTGTSGRYGFVTCVTKEDAQKAIKELDGHDYGRGWYPLKVDWATPRNT